MSERDGVLCGRKCELELEIESTVPVGNFAVRQALYAGRIFLLPPTAASLRLAEEALALLEREFGAGCPIRRAQFRLTDEEFFHAVGRLRKVLYEEPRFYHAMAEVAQDWGFVQEENAFDPLRLRVSKHAGKENLRAAPLYSTHRDTWYAHPQCQISWWIPLHDVEAEETFVFFPEYFARAVPNDSGAFDYDHWEQDRRGLRIGWQDPEAGRQALYPACTTDLEGARQLPFACRKGEVLLFSGAHLHRTLGHRAGRTRFSCDFRTVHLGDLRAGVGAPNSDNRSRGSALPQYFLPQEPALHA